MQVGAGCVITSLSKYDFAQGVSAHAKDTQMPPEDDADAFRTSKARPLVSGVCLCLYFFRAGTLPVVIPLV